MNDERLQLPGLDLHLRAALRRPKAPGPLVILVHGFKGFMDWGCWPWVAGELAAAGYACLRFNFSHNGIGEDLQAFTELDRFQANTFSREVAELRAVIRAAADLPGVDPGEVHLLGHSRGGAIALLASQGVRGVVTWSSLAELDGLHGFKGREAAWRRKGFVEVKNARTGQIMRLGSGLLEDWEAHRRDLDVTAALARFRVQGGAATAIHGAADTGVPLEHGLRLEAAGARLVVIPEGDHTFGAAHPFQADPPAPLRQALRATLEALV